MEETFAKVTKFCHNYLLQNDNVMNYLKNKRKLTLESINKFQIGLFPKDLRELFEKIDPKDLRSSGLIRHASSSIFKTYNLVMPIKNVYDDYIAFAGRVLLSGAECRKRGIPKYKNSVYKKSHHLFGFNFAKNSILEKGVVYIVEGYFDVIMPHQKGMKNVVATCGSFLSVRHLSLLSRYTDKIVIILDNEPNAQDTAKKIVEKRQYEGLNITSKNPLKDKANDIDEYLREHTIDELMNNLKKRNYDNIKPFWD
jgi:DNA primase